MQYISAQSTFQEIQNGKAVLLDVREEYEVREGLAEHAIWIPTSQIAVGGEMWLDFLETAPTDKKIVCYCAAGMRSAQVAAYLVSQGYDAANMGGYDDWLMAGLPTKTL